MIWLPRTTDNSTYFAQSLEIRGIESRLYVHFNGQMLNGVFEQFSFTSKFLGLKMQESNVLRVVFL